MSLDINSDRLCPESTAQTPSVIGSSTPTRADSSLQHRCGRDSLDGLADLRERLRRGQTLGDQLAGAAVAAVAAPARDDQVAHSGEAGERLGARAERLAEPRHLREAARDQRRLAVVAEVEPVEGAGGERDHVLRGGAELDADDVRIDVRTEDGGVDGVLELAREEAVLARDHGRGRQAARDLLRHVRAGEHRDAAAVDARREPLAASPGRGPSSGSAPARRREGRRRRPRTTRSAPRRRPRRRRPARPSSATASTPRRSMRVR